MMRSTLNNGGAGGVNDDDDDDEFAPNPFRDSTDFFDAPRTVQQQQQQQHQQYGVQSPDPNSGMVGSLNISPPQQQQGIDYNNNNNNNNPALYLSGPMDQKAPGISLTPGGGTQQQPQPPPSIFSWRGLVACFRMDAAARLFDVDTADVAARLKAAATQFHRPDYFRLSVVGSGGGAGDDEGDDHEGAGVIVGGTAVSDHRSNKGPDLYGPVWISMTLVFILGVTANLSDYIKRDADAEFEYDLVHLLNAMYVVFLFAFGLPTAFWLACHCLGMPGISWATWICHYGYSLTPIILGALVAWWLPYTLWHWLVLAAAVAASGLLIVRNLSTPLLSQDAESSHAKAAPLILSILGAHFTYLLVLKLTFYP